MSDVRNHPEALSSEDLARIEAEERARREVRRRLDEEEAELKRQQQREREARAFSPAKAKKLLWVVLGFLTLATLPASLVVWFVVLAFWALIKFVRK
jgi:hypothetical protein